MQLVAVRVENCRSIEKAELVGLDQINVLIGKNNAGKSSFFQALQFVAQLLQGTSSEWQRTVRAQTPLRPFRVDLEGELTLSEREYFFRTVVGQNDYSDQILSSVLASPAFSRARFVFEMDLPQYGTLHLTTTSVLSSDNAWAICQRMKNPNEVGTSNPEFEFAALGALGINGSFAANAIGLGGGVPINGERLSIGDWIGRTKVNPFMYLQSLCMDFLSRAFFLGPSRRSGDSQPAQVGAPLASDGGNLPQVLLDALTNDREKFDKIAQFLRDAIPDAGLLQTPMTDTLTRPGVRLPGIAAPVPLVDMGTGVQHIVMLGYLLIATRQDRAVFIEEPETNIHPGAQRFLLEQLKKDGRQFFLTSHSPVFVSPDNGRAVFKVESVGNSATAHLVSNRADLESTLNTLGVRNSDILFSDAVLFVEGKSDRDILKVWAETLGVSLDAQGTSILLVESTEAAVRDTKTRSELLQQLSQATTVPHRILLDRDERPEAELKALRGVLGESVHVLARRELENYLLVPNILARVMSARFEQQKQSPPDYLDMNWVDNKITEHASKLKPVVLLKRIRAALPRLDGGPFPRKMAEELSSVAGARNLAARITGKVQRHHSAWLSGAKIATVIRREKKIVESQWTKPATMRAAAPGADILELLFKDVGLKYEKTKDGPKIATMMTADQIPAEIATFLKSVPGNTVG